MNISTTEHEEIVWTADSALALHVSSGPQFIYESCPNAWLQISVLPKVVLPNTSSPGPAALLLISLHNLYRSRSVPVPFFYDFLTPT